MCRSGREDHSVRVLLLCLQPKDVITAPPPHPTPPPTIRDVSRKSEVQVSGVPSRMWDIGDASVPSRKWDVPLDPHFFLRVVPFSLANPCPVSTGYGLELAHTHWFCKSLSAYVNCFSKDMCPQLHETTASVPHICRHPVISFVCLAGRHLENHNVWIVIITPPPATINCSE